METTLASQSRTKRDTLKPGALFAVYAILSIILAVLAALLVTSDPLGRFLAAVCGAVLGCIVTFAGDYLLLARPLERLMAREREPLSVTGAISYPSVGVPAVHFILRAFDDFRAQREAFGRLIEAYRFMAQMDQERMTWKNLSVIAFQAGLALTVTPFVADLEEDALAPLSPGPELDPSKRAFVLRQVATDHLEFADEGVFWLSRPFASNENRHLVLRVEPRKLWSRFPKVYRRFFAALAGVMLEHVANRSDSTQSPSSSSTSRTNERRRGKTFQGLDDASARVGAAFDWIDQGGALADDGSSDSLEHGASRLHIIGNGSLLTDSSLLPPSMGLAYRGGTRASADLFGMVFEEADNLSLVSLGTVQGIPSELAVAATHLSAIVAACFDRHQLVKRTKSSAQGLSPTIDQSTKEQMTRCATDIVTTVQTHLHHVFKGKLGAQFTISIFDHSSGQGQFVSFGAPLPYLSSPEERKPLQLAQSGARLGLLGIAPVQTIKFTPFQVIAGQVLLLCSSGLLAVRDEKGKTFEREILRGRLGVIDPESRRSAAGVFAAAVIAEAEKHNSNSFLSEDTTVVCLAPEGTFSGR
jgi:hypothetical protein